MSPKEQNDLIIMKRKLRAFYEETKQKYIAIEKNETEFYKKQLLIKGLRLEHKLAIHKIYLNKLNETKTIKKDIAAALILLKLKFDF